MGSRAIHSHLSQEEASFLSELLSSSEEGSAVVLVGSVARRQRSGPWSDFDLLVVDGSSPEAPPSVHLIELKTAVFERRVMEGDDFVQWALRFGESIHGREKWMHLVDYWLPRAPWPSAERKLSQARDRLRVCETLLGVGDVLSAQKEAVYAGSHLARAVLLAHHEFPLSRPELPIQLRALHKLPVAEAIQLLNSAPLTEDVLQRCIADLKDAMRSMADGASSVNRAR